MYEDYNTKQWNYEGIVLVRTGNFIPTVFFLQPWYIRNNDLHRDLEVDIVSSGIQRFAQKHEESSTIMRTLRPYSS